MAPSEKVMEKDAKRLQKGGFMSPAEALRRVLDLLCHRRMRCLTSKRARAAVHPAAEASHDGVDTAPVPWKFATRLLSRGKRL